MTARVVFMGSPEFSVPSLEALCVRYQVVLVITQPDRKQGRGQHMEQSPVKKAALERQLEIWQPLTLRASEAIQRLREIRPDLYVTAAIGHILTPEVLAIPRYGCVNVHASLLPRWRGAAPINAAILHGDAETGITLMKTDPGLDTGPILSQSRCSIRLDDTAETLAQRLASLGVELLNETLPRWLAGEIVPRPQPNEGITYSRRLEKDDGLIDWYQSASFIERMIRAYVPWPGTFTIWHGRRLGILRAQALLDWSGKAAPGTVFVFGKETAVATGHGALVLQEIQLAGKRPMSIEAFCRGQRDFLGVNLAS